tara:strand:- start:547 stop:669 length:123 start_codon:yes stop_codon:yes gene_type:complete
VEELLVKIGIWHIESGNWRFMHGENWAEKMARDEWEEMRV